MKRVRSKRENKMLTVGEQERQKQFVLDADFRITQFKFALFQPAADFIDTWLKCILCVIIFLQYLTFIVDVSPQCFSSWG